MEKLILTLHIVVCVVLVILVLLQSGKEGMGVIFGGGSSSLFGSTGAGGILVKLTTFVAVIFLATSLGYNIVTSAQTTRHPTVIDIPLDDPSAPPKPAVPANATSPANATLPGKAGDSPALGASDKAGTQESAKPAAAPASQDQKSEPAPADQSAKPVDTSEKSPEPTAGEKPGADGKPADKPENASGTDKP